jgi:UDP-2,4-diacetamido-2,4,6-trideoxy-beta-L-altropyranose hydrolase
MKAVIVTEGFNGTGYGHLTRCLSIYQAFEERGITPTTIADCDETGEQVLNHINPVVLDWRTNIDEVVRLAENADVMVIDSYLADAQTYERLRQTSRTIVCLDDNLRIEYPPGVVLNGAIGAEKLPYPRGDEHRHLLGVDYVPLRKEFWDVPLRADRRHIEDVFVMFGAQDIRHMTVKTLRYLLKCFPEYTFHVVSMLNSDGGDDCCDSQKTKFYRNLPASEILRLMQRCDLAISAAGQTTYELACVGLPSVVVGVAGNQQNSIRGWIEAGFLRSELWWDDADLLDAVAEEICEIANGGHQSRTFCDGQGARRLAKYLSEEHVSESEKSSAG